MDEKSEKREKNEEIDVFGDICLRKKRRKRQKILIIQLLEEYAQNSTLHGLRYITEKGLSIMEKLFWLVTFLLCCGFCFYLIHNVWVKWKTSPVIVTFSEEVLSVAKVPFPSVTICPQTKIITKKYNYSEVYVRMLNHNVTAEEVRIFLDVNTMCVQSQELDYQFDEYIHTYNHTNSSLAQNLFHAAPNLDDVILQCTWRGEMKSCEELFKATLTVEGVCYTFNTLAANELLSDRVEKNYSPFLLQTKTPTKNWDIATGYINSDEDPYPWRGMENGPTPDLELILADIDTDNQSPCNSLSKGYKMFVQNPVDMPQSNHYYYAALVNQVSSVAIKFSMLNTSETLQNYDPKVRQCYFPKDFMLAYFKVYTPNNCRLECQSNYTYSICKCVWFNMPHAQGMDICTLGKKECVQKVQSQIAKGAMRDALGGDSKPAISCPCLPSCHSIEYDAEILKTEFDVNNFYKQMNEVLREQQMDFTPYNYSKVEMYFKEPRFVSMRRSELFGLTDFLANCGGVLGLFTGFSILSLVEFCYFVSLRLCCRLKRDLETEKESNYANDLKVVTIS